MWSIYKCDCDRRFAVEQSDDPIEEPACPECGQTYTTWISDMPEIGDRGLRTVDDHIKVLVEIVKSHSPKAFINRNNELIVEPRNNIYFRLEDISDELHLKCKVLAWLSRPSCKGVSNYWQGRIRRIVNEFLETSFTKDQIYHIYTYLGNDVNRPLCIKFIESGYDMTVLPEAE